MSKKITITKNDNGLFDVRVDDLFDDSLNQEEAMGEAVRFLFEQAPRYLRTPTQQAAWNIRVNADHATDKKEQS